MPDNLNMFGFEYSDVSGFKAKDENNNTLTYIRPNGTKTITSNGSSIDVSAFAFADVQVPGGGTITLQDKTASPSESVQTITPDSGYDGLSSVEISAIQTQTKTATPSTSSNTITPDSGKYLTSVTVSAIQTQTKSATPSETAQTITPDSGKFLTSVSIAAVSSTYVGSGIDRRSSEDLTSSGATVSVPTGYYENAASKSVASGTAGTPTATKGSVSGNAITVTPSVTNTAGYISGGTVTGTGVSVSASELVSGTKSITSNGTGIDVTNYASVDVNVESPEPSLQSKTVTPTESEQVATPDQGYDGLSSVTVSAISSSYVGSLIDRNDSTDLSVSGGTITVPAGYYAETASKSVANGFASTPATTITTNPTISVSATGLITASVSGSQNVTPTVSAGYVSAGTAGAVSVSGSQTQQLSTQAAATITPTKSSQTAIAAGKYTTGAVTVAAIPAAYQDVTGVTAVAGDIVSGKSIVDSSGATVNGTLVIQHYYTGSSTPSASLGVDGDIYLQTS